MRAGRPLPPGLLVEEEEEEDAEGDGEVGEVEGGPAEGELQEVRDGAGAQAIEDVAEGAPEEHSDGEPEEGPVGVADEVEEEGGEGEGDEDRHGELVARDEAEGDAVVACVDELDPREEATGFAGKDGVLDEALGELVEEEDGEGDERR
jgi:hypothetical protein